MSAVAALTDAHITCLSCGAVTPMQLIQDHNEEFLEEMNCTVLVPYLKALGLIPAIIENNVLQSKNRKEANAHLLQHLKEDADEESVMEVFRIAASQERAYGRMTTFADDVLRKLQRGLYWCVHTQKSCCCCVLLMYRTSVYVSQLSLPALRTMWCKSVYYTAGNICTV